MASLKDFADLKSLRGALKDQEQQRAAEAAETAKRDQTRAHEANLFRNSVSNVARLPQQDKLAPLAPPKTMTPRQQEDDDRAVLRESLSDLFEVDALMAEDPGLSYTRPGVGADVVRKMRKGHWPLQDDLDLHGLRRDTARDSLGEFLRQATRRKLRCVRVIHGKGLGSKGQEPVLKSMVHSWLVQKDEVIAFCQARRSEGGDGALTVLLQAALQVVR